jgi:superoxide dismutase, Fe-Mn family
VSRYTLPDLPYDHGALEPHISGRILELHHGKHHKAYVDGANRALEQLQTARARGDFSQIATHERALAFNVSGHVLHSLFWQNLSPDGGGEPPVHLGEAIGRDFGSVDLLRKQMNAAGAAIMGSGWVALVWDPLSGSLLTAQIHDHQSETLQGSIPLLVIDAWEHAYYLQYQNEKAKFFEAIWNVVNWQDVAARFETAQSVDLQLNGVGEEVYGEGEPRETPRRQPPPEHPPGRA